MRKNTLLSISLCLFLPQIAMGVELDTDSDGLLNIEERRLDAELVATGGAHTCFIDAGGDREVTCWGDNSHDQAAVPTDLVNPVAITAGFYHSCVLEDTNALPGVDTNVRCWGRDDSGQSTVPALLDPVAITAGFYHTCALDANGATCWGLDDDGQSTAPILASPVAISAGAWHTCAIDATGLQCWGLNNDGETTVPTDLENPVAVSAGLNQTCAIDDNGVRCWGRDLDEGAVYSPDVMNPSAIATNGWHTCVMGASAVSCWGQDDYGQSTVPTGPDALVNPTAIALGWNHTCAIDASGMHCWGDNSRGQSDVSLDMLPPAPVNQGVIAAGGAHTCAIDPGATRDVSCWGYNVNGQSDVPTDLLNPVAIDGGWFHTCAIDDNGARCWGSTGADGNGLLVDQGQSTVPTGPDALVNPVAITTGAYHTCTNDDNGVSCWGVNDDGQTSVPVALESPVLPVTSVSAGGWHTCAIDGDGVVQCWGRDDHGQSTVPDPALVNPIVISAGGLHTCAIDDSGVVCWGNDDFGQSTIPTGPDALMNPVAIVAGGGHTCAIDDSGVHCWGLDDFGQSTVPTGLDALLNPVAVTAGWSHTCAIDDNGLVCWGANSNGESVVPQDPGLYRAATATKPLDDDSDNDGLLDGDEVNIHGTDPWLVDTDSDGSDDDVDNCPVNANSGQLDTDVDTIGDVCDPDTAPALITSYYGTILGRAPEPGGLPAWEAEMVRLTGLGMDSKEGYITLAKLFFNSAEYLGLGKSDEDFVTDLYFTFFDRTPSGAERDAWVAEIVGGVSRNTVMNFFVFSPEFNTYMEARFGPAAARPENNMVNDFYRGLLSRAGEDGGYLYWLGRLQTAQCSADAAGISSLAYQVASLFTTLQEYIDRNRDSAEFIEDIYDGIMRRNGDAAGISFWVNELDTGARTRDDVLQFFTGSTEFQGRVTDVINTGCLFSSVATALPRAQNMLPSMQTAEIKTSAAESAEVSSIEPGSLTGIWSSATETDWGISITHQDASIFAAFYTFDTNGFPRWYVASNCQVSSDGCNGALHEVTGGSPLTDAWNASNLQLAAIGSVEFSFTDANNGVMQFDIHGVSGTKTITRQVSNIHLPNVEMTGQWLNTAESGWFATLIQQSNITFALVYTYDSDGFPIWYVAYNCPITNNGCTGNLYEVMGGSALSDSWDGANLNVTKVGTISITLIDPENGTMAFELNGVSGSRQITRQIWVPEP